MLMANQKLHVMMPHTSVDLAIVRSPPVCAFDPQLSIKLRKYTKLEALLTRGASICVIH